MTWRIVQGDCIEPMRALEPGSVDAVVCDPPYGLSREPDVAEVLRHWLAGDDYEHRGGGFMGQSWDSFVPGPAYWSEVFRALKPGGHLVAFGGTRTYDLLVIAVRFAGFEIRDCLAWLFGSGFPKSLDVGKAIDKAAGAEREIVGERRYADGAPPRERAGTDLGAMNDDGWEPSATRVETAPATPDAEQWAGWGTALKPAHEPIVVARKPLSGTVAANVLEYGTGAINVDGCRIAAGERPNREMDRGRGAGHVYDGGVAGDFYGSRAAGTTSQGRWPANVVLDEEAAALLDEQSGDRPSGSYGAASQDVFGSYGERETASINGSRGGASRFFYCAKASRSERDAGLVGLPLSDERAATTPTSTIAKGRSGGKRVDDREYAPEPRANVHPTVKPIALMRWLVRLVTPPGGLVLDPFAGSGTTGCAAVLEDFDFIGVEREPEYAAIARARIAYWSDPRAHELLLAEARRLEAEGAAAESGAPVQLGLELDGEAA